MSSTSTELIITQILEDNLLKRIPQNKAVERASSVHKDNSFSLFWEGGSFLETYINNSYCYSNKFKLEITYITKTEEEKRLAQDNFVSIINLLKANTNFDGFLDNGFDFTLIDNEHSKGVLRFLFGLEKT